jgi:acyl-CoA synthetase (AMP-forming)/AMP-acid ligase II
VKTLTGKGWRLPGVAAAAEVDSIVALLRLRATEQPNDLAYIFLPDRAEAVSLSFGDLYKRAHAVARNLAERGQKGDRAVLVFPPGLDFIIGFFGCLLAGVIAVPMMIPRRDSSRGASMAILADCAPRFVITRKDLISGTRTDLVERFRSPGVNWILADCDAEAAEESKCPLPVFDRSDIAFLQYTSGSTSVPKGVVVSHGNLIDNSEMIRIAFGNTRSSTHVSWVPLYHDMGLILNVLQSLYVGASCVLLAPVSFMQRPLSWLRAIHDYRAEVAGGPNFAFDLCVRWHRPELMQGIDLSCWKVAFSGAEPVRPETIERFAAIFAPYGFDPNTTHPAYGMAEATLLISARERGAGPIIRTVSREALAHHRAVAPMVCEDAHRVVGCGRQLLGERLAIVDPDSRRPLPPGLIGEVWVGGPHVAQGYWRNPESTEAVFRARIEGDAAECWLRTGDFGFLDEVGELYITGRIKDLIIIRGVNHYPQDIEATVQACHPALRSNYGAAFSLDQDGEEQLVVVQEIERTYRRRIAVGDIIASIREAIAREHEIAAREIVLIGTGTLPKTTSGKIQRRLTRQMFLAGSLAVLQ